MRRLPASLELGLLSCVERLKVVSKAHANLNTTPYQEKLISAF
jgi:hypothetical protein